MGKLMWGFIFGRGGVVAFKYVGSFSCAEP